MNAEVTITGAIWKIFPVFHSRDCAKRIFWVRETTGQYPMTFQLELWHDDYVTMLSVFKEADMVECKCQIIGRMYQKRTDNQDAVYHTIRCLQITKI